MTVTRRTFLRKGAITTFLAGLALDSIPRVFAQGTTNHDPKQDFHISSEAKQGSASALKREMFEPYLRGVFTLGAGPNSVEAKLMSIRDCSQNPKARTTPKTRKSDSFALVFRSDGKLTDLTTIYDVEHPRLGRFPLFLTRRDGPQNNHFYEAVFNHAL
jgi:hypothetical protein